MSAPGTHLLVAPDDADDLLGQTMTSADLIRGLQRISPEIYIHTQGRAHSGIWSGQPGAPGTRFVCAFHLGAIPEWTQIGPDGTLICKGWRAIFEKVIKHGLASPERLEREFRVSLGTSGVAGLCGRCVREGRRERHNGGKRKMCDLHDQVYDQNERAGRNRPELEARLHWRRKAIYNIG